MARTLGALLALALLAGCTVAPPYPDAGERLATFRPLDVDPRVRYAPGAEAYARRVAALLPAAVAQVEARHYLPFAQAVEIHVCDSDDCFRRYVPEPPNLTAAVAYDNRLILHPRLFEREPERLQPILLHELSHLHLGQRLGHYTPAVPVWFHEGLASSVADGGGADLVSEDAARSAMREGRRFDPGSDLGGLPRHYADAWGLDISTFYRQCMLFVDWLRAGSEQSFRDFLLELQGGEQFAPSFGHSYKRSVRSAGQDFASDSGAAGR